MSFKRNKISSLLLPISIITLVVLINILYDPSNLEETKEAITFSPLDLKDDKIVENAIIGYLVNRDNEPEEYKLVDFETIDTEYNISLTLQDILEVEGTSLENQTKSSKIRFFIASYIDYSKPYKETHLTGWIDEHKILHECARADGGLFIDKVIHQAVIEVDEEGTEAAAATGVVVALSGHFGDVFRADHPFLFFIRDKQTGVILFMGRMADPTL